MTKDWEFDAISSAFAPMPLLFAGLAELGEHEAGDAYVEQAKGGKHQVPCLFIDGKPLYESSDIIAWFEQNA